MLHLWQRVTAATPPFFRRLRNLAAGALAIVGALLSDADRVGEDIAHYLRYAFVGLTTVVGTAQLAWTDPDDEKEKAAAAATPATVPTPAV